VYVATPNSEHRAHCLLAIGQRKAVVCEKPFALDAAQAREVVTEARRMGVFCMEAMWPRFVPIMAELESQLREGAIGTVRLVVAQLGMKFVPDPTHRVFSPSLGGGALLDLGVYPLALASRLLGRPERISAHAVMGPTGVDEQIAMVLDYQGGAQAVLTASIRGPLTNDAVITGADGLLHLRAPLYCPDRFSLSRPGLRARVAGASWARGLQTLVSQVRSATTRRRVLGNGYTHEALEVMRCLRAGDLESPQMPLDETVEIMHTIDRIRVACSPSGVHA
jgi:predicted dehydrogenase